MQCLLYPTCRFIDVIGNARVAGLQVDLGLTDTQYQICVTVLFVSVQLVLRPSQD